MSRPRTILIIDDNATSRALVRIFLMGEPFELLEAATGDDALSLVRVTPPAAIVADYHMDGLDGVSLTRALKADRSLAVREVPVIILTGDETDDAEALARDAGAAGYLRKPVTPAALKAALARVLPA